MAVVQLQKDVSALLFSAESGGVSGWQVYFALLGPGFEDLLLADVTVSNQNQHAFWNEPAISDQPMLLMANYAAGSDEAHYGPHRYIISAYFPNRLYDAAGVYLLQDQYMTIRTYDLQEHVDILGAEKQEILARLRRVKSSQTLR
jgi:hypothetical protein